MPGHRPSAADRRSREGFTLIEMLTVLLVVGAMMAITIGVILNSQSATGLRGAEATIASLVRQARHTALSTGAPVQLRFNKDQNSVTGVTQQVVLADNFERNFDPSTRQPTTKRDIANDPKPMPGLAGYGCNAWHDSNEGNLTQNLRELRGDTNVRLMRKVGDGFYLSCWVRPPLARNAGSNYRCEYYHLPSDPQSNHGDRGKTRGYLPLLLIGDANPLTAFAGLTLELRELVVQVGPNGPVVTHHWVPVGWAGGNSSDSNIIEYYPEADTTRGNSGRNRLAHVTSTNRNAINPIGGERWIQLGLLYDGENVKLYVDDAEAEAKPLSLGVHDLAPNCHVGYAEHAGGLKAGPALIDSVRVLRLGSDNPIKLPANVLLETDYRVTIDAGQTTLAKKDGAGVWRSGDTIEVRDRASAHTGKPAKEWAKIFISGIGSVSSEMGPK